MAGSAFALANLNKVQARIAKMKPATRKALEDQLETESEDLVDAIKRAMEAQYDTSDHDHESLIDSVHAYQNPDRVISRRIIADAKDAKDEFIGSHVEAGHRAVDGTHVPGKPAFFPVYRSRKKGIQRRLSKAARDATKKAFESGV